MQCAHLGLEVTDKRRTNPFGSPIRRGDDDRDHIGPKYPPLVESGPRHPRGISRTDAERLGAVQREIVEDSKAYDRLGAIELLLAEYFGRDGTGGRFATMERQLTEHDRDLVLVLGFRDRFRWTFGLLSAAGGAVMAVAIIVVEHLLK